MSTRSGGVSAGAYDSLNVSCSVGDDALAATENRRRVEQSLGLPIFSPHLVHGASVVRIDQESLQLPRPKADACWTNDHRVACGVTAADCLPVLLCSADGMAVAAAHAGWRGLAAGVLQNTVAALAQGSGCEPASMHAWLGPCIGPQHFEVGMDVLHAFNIDPDEPAITFVPRLAADGTRRWLADLPALARDCLARAGVRAITGGHWCTVAESSRFFSYRRDRVTGRMLAAVGCVARSG